jgi:hypothetical protein
MTMPEDLIRVRHGDGNWHAYSRAMFEAGADDGIYTKEWKVSMGFYHGGIFTPVRPYPDDICEKLIDEEESYMKANPKMGHSEARRAYGLEAPASATRGGLPDKESVREKVDMGHLIVSYCQGKMTRRGDRMMVCCCLHGEFNPSMSVNLKDKFYKCFSCQESGDCFTLVMKMEGVGFMDALRKLHEMYP